MVEVGMGKRLNMKCNKLSNQGTCVSQRCDKMSWPLALSIGQNQPICPTKTVLRTCLIIDWITKQPACTYSSGHKRWQNSHLILSTFVSVQKRKKKCIYKESRKQTASFAISLQLLQWQQMMVASSTSSITQWDRPEHIQTYSFEV